jgi:hypothetical protein
LCGIKFFFTHTLKREWTTLKFVRPEAVGRADRPAIPFCSPAGRTVNRSFSGTSPQSGLHDSIIPGPCPGKYDREVSALPGRRMTIN